MVEWPQRLTGDATGMHGMTIYSGKVAYTRYRYRRTRSLVHLQTLWDKSLLWLLITVKQGDDLRRGFHIAEVNDQRLGVLVRYPRLLPPRSLCRQRSIFRGVLALLGGGLVVLRRPGTRDSAMVVGDEVLSKD